MPDFMTPKAIANRIKSKGLQKLKFFCQMCQKQCRDENGFKCHCKSESHVRQMALFAQNPDKFMDSFSKAFEKSFVELLSRRFGTRRVHANIVYNEYIQDKQHAHMNSTMWTTLTDFVKYLGRTGKCTIDEDPEKGWHIAWINRDPEAVRRQEEAAKRKDRELDDDARYEAEIEAIAEAARRAAAEGALPEGSDDADGDDDGDGDQAEDSSGQASGQGQPRPAGASRAQKSHALDLEKARAEGGAVKISLGGGLRPAGGAVSAGPSSSSSAAGQDESCATAGRKRPRPADLDDGDEVPLASRAAPMGLAFKPQGGASAAFGGSWSSGASGASSSGTGQTNSGSAASQRPGMSNIDKLIAEAEAEKQRKLALSGGAAAAAPTCGPAAGPAAKPAQAGHGTSGPAPAPPSKAGPAGMVDEEWLLPGIIVRVMNKTVGNGLYYKQKGEVTKVVDLYAAHVRLTIPTDGNGAGDGATKTVTLKLDVADLETTCPAVGGGVIIVARGLHRGRRGTVRALHVDSYCADIELEKASGAFGHGHGTLLTNVEYEAFSRAAQ